MAAVVAWRLPTSRDPDTPRLDVAGLVLSTAAIGSLVFTTIEAPEVGWATARSGAGFAAAAVLFALFVAWERREAEPMLDVGLFRNLRFTAASGSVTVAFFALFGFVFMVTQHFQFLKGYNPFGTGVRLLSVATSVAVASIVGTKLAVRIGNKAVVAVIGSVFASLYAGRLALPAGLPVQAAQAARASVGGAFIAAGRVADAGLAPVAAQLRTAASAAFFDGFAVGCLVAAGVALTGATAAAILLPAQPHVATDDAAADAVVDTTAEPALVHAA